MEETRNRKSFLSNALYKQLVSGDNLDAVLIAGAERVRLPVHLSVLAAASDVLVTGLAPRWRKRPRMSDDENEQKKMAEIELPGTISGLTISVDAAKALVKLIYGKNFGDVQETISLGNSQQLLALVDMFLNQDLIDIFCTEFGENHLNHESTLDILKLCVNLPRCKVLYEKGIALFWSEFKQFLAETTSSWWEELWERVLKMEGPEIADYKEIDLFEKLLCWRDEDSSREEGFRRLLKLIRFPIMETKLISGKVRKSGVLTDVELYRILAYLTTEGPEWDTVQQDFISYNRSPKTASSSLELKNLLRTAVPGDVINLEAGEFHGPFKVKADKIVIRGKGSQTKIMCAHVGFVVRGHDVCITSMAIMNNSTSDPQEPWDTLGIEGIGSRNRFEHISFTSCSLKISSNFNRCNHLFFVDKTAALLVEGSSPTEGNNLSNISFRNTQWGLVLFPGSGKCMANNISCINVHLGLQIESDRNVVQNVTFETSEGENHRGLVLSGGSKNTLENIIVNDCKQKEKDEQNPKNRKVAAIGETTILVDITDRKEGAVIFPSCDNTLINCGPGSCRVSGERNSFVNVDAAEYLIISGKSHSFKECKAEKVTSTGVVDLELIDCNFVV